MYHRQSFPRLGDYIATVLQVTRLTKSIIRISGGIGSDTYNSFLSSTYKCNFLGADNKQ